jgi:hypothetical protein
MACSLRTSTYFRSVVLEKKKASFKACLPHDDEYKRPLFYVIANEPVLVKGFIYPEGAEIPDSVWNPAYLEVALRMGTVRRRTTAALTSEEPTSLSVVRKRFIPRKTGSRGRRVS